MRVALAIAAVLSILSSPARAQDTLDPAVSNDLRLETLETGFDGPTAAEFLPDGRIVVIEQLTGRIKLWNGSTTRTIGTIGVQTGFERGLLGLAVDPQFAQTRRLYLYYSQDNHQKAGWVQLDANDDVMGPPTVILEDMGGQRNHNGGGMVFGPDNHLYIGVGDTGCNCRCAPGENQSNYYPTCLTNFQGKILRIDRDGRTPSSNPLVGVEQVPQCTGTTDCRNGGNVFPSTLGAPATEIYNWGFRNPWRFAFDEQTGFLWIGDVGEISWEEITVSTGPGQHHGWPFREGANGQAVAACSNVIAQSGDCREPAFEYPRSEAPNRSQASVTGGVFSNHCSWPEPWSGRYWFGDFVKARVWTLTPNAARDGVEGERTVAVQGASGPVHFFVGPNGGIHYVASTSGAIIRITPAEPIDCGSMDAGIRLDSGPEPVDGSAAIADASAPIADAGVTDATPMPLDMGREDSGSEDPATDEDGCSCRSTRVNPNETPSYWPWLALFVVTAVRIRRRA